MREGWGRGAVARHVLRVMAVAVVVATAWWPAVAGPPAAPAPASVPPLRVMTFNVRLPTDADGDNR